MKKPTEPRVVVGAMGPPDLRNFPIEVRRAVIDIMRHKTPEPEAANELFQILAFYGIDIGPIIADCLERFLFPKQAAEADKDEHNRLELACYDETTRLALPAMKTLYPSDPTTRAKGEAAASYVYERGGKRKRYTVDQLEKKRTRLRAKQRR
jgi:hypothetical protein